MKKGIFAIVLATSFNSMAMDYVGALYNPADGVIFGSTDIVLGSTSYDLRNDTTNAKVSSNDITSQLLRHRTEIGFGNGLTGLVNLNYYINQIEDDGSNEEEARGFERIDLGARYRLSDKMKLPTIVDVGGTVKLSLFNREEATSTDQGTTNSGGHEINLFARAGSNKLFVKADLALKLEQQVDSATTGDSRNTVDPSMDLSAEIGSQFSPMSNLVLEGAAAITRIGEQTLNFTSGGDQTNDAVIGLGFNFKAYYQFMKNVSAQAGVSYRNFQDQNIDGNQDFVVEGRTLTDINIGASYRF